MRASCASISEAARGFAKLLLVHGLRVEDALRDHLQFVAFELTEEAALVALVARGAADLLHLEQHGVGVAVDEDALHLLEVAALLALAPQLVAAAAEVDRAVGAHGLLERFAVHPREHQHL